MKKTKIDFGPRMNLKVISLCYKEDYYQHFLFISLWFLFMTGMRIGEATAIQWEDIETTLGTYGHLYPNSNFEVAHKLEGIMSYQTATQNEVTSPKNQFTARYLRKDVDSNTNNAITMQ